jgi:hypothetical protein
MTEKLELLEERFRDTLEETRSAVEGIVENVKGTVDDTVGVVKETVEGAKTTVDTLVENVKGTMDDTATMVKKSFDLNYQVEQRPWVMLGGSVLLGYMLGSWMSRGNSYQREFFNRGYYYDDDTMYATPKKAKTSSESPNFSDSRERTERDFSSDWSRTQTAAYSQPKARRWSTFTDQFQDEWDTLKSIALGTLMGTLRSMVRQHMPSVAPKLEQAINSASEKLGTEPIDVSDEQSQAHGHNSHSQGQQAGTVGNRSTTTASSEATPTNWSGSQTGTGAGSSFGPRR